MAGIRLFPKSSVHAKLQDPREVIPALRALGSDDAPMMDQLKPFYQGIQEISETGFKDVDGKDVANIRGRV